jgi:phosphoglycolate phosphatase
MKAWFDVDAVLIDLDGTLLDTVADLAAATNAMLAELGRAPLDLATVAAYVGKGAAILVHRALGGGLDARVPAAEFDPAMAAFLRHYERENGLRATPYDGVFEGLEAMRGRGLALACVTNKPQRFADALLERCAMARYFELVVGGDALERRKPDPLPMRHAAARLGVEPRRCLAIGDSVNDALAARAAGMPVLAVPYGYNEGRDVRELDVDGIVATLAEAAGRIRPRSRG